MFTPNDYRFTGYPGAATLAALAIAGLAVAGCQSTALDQRTAQADPDAWASQLATLPIEVHGTLPGVDAAETLARVPNGVATDSLESTRRIVLYVGGTAVPVNTEYCDVSASLHSVDMTNDKVLLSAALCDGSRLVVSAHQEFTPAELAPSTLSGSVEELKVRLNSSLATARRHAPGLSPIVATPS